MRGKLPLGLVVPSTRLLAVFFGMEDAEAAQAYRVEMVRTWVSGLRITVQTLPTAPTRIGSIVVRESRFPAMISPVAGRRAGGGYIAMDPADPEHMRELAAQGAADLARWVERYEGVASHFGVSVECIKEIAASLTGGVADAA